MKWLIPAATLLLSVESNASLSSSHACFAPNSRPFGVPMKQKHSSTFQIMEPREKSINVMNRDNTSLSMGIRSMLGLGKKTKDDDDKEKSENPQDIKKALEAIKADLEAVEDEESKKPKRKGISIMGRTSSTNDSKKKSNSLLNRKKDDEASEKVRPSSDGSYGETVRDRINRVKQGQMTDEEKAAFLNAALTSSPKGTPIKPQKKSESSKAPPKNPNLPQEALWNTIGKTSSSNRDEKGGGSAYSRLPDKDDEAKREYLEMITNPDRFKSYAAMGGRRASSASANSVASSTSTPSVEEKNEVVDNLGMLDAPIGTEGDADMAAKLEAAAHAKEIKDAEARAKKEEEERIFEEKRREDQRKRIQEIRKEAEARLATERAEQEKLLNFEREKREAEKMRLGDMQAAQDEYWKKKLEEEKGQKERTMSVQEKARLAEQREQEKAAELAAAARKAAKQAEIEMLREEEAAREDPHEAHILEEAAEDELHTREENADIMERASAMASHTVPLPRSPDVSAASFVEEQEKKKDALNELRKSQSERLASLNSPLPSLSENPKFESKPIQSSEPKKPVGIMPSLNLGNLTMKQQQTDDVKPAEESTDSATKIDSEPRLNLEDLTMAKKPVTQKREPVAPPETDTKIPSLAEMTMLKNDQTKKVKSPPPVSAPSGSSPIRQSIPIAPEDDEEEDDFFEFTRNGGNSGMSIKDIMTTQGADTSADSTSKSDAAKQQSKMWGIDIDKFMD